VAGRLRHFTLTGGSFGAVAYQFFGSEHKFAGCRKSTMTTEKMEAVERQVHSWFALQVRTRWESSISVLLGGKGYETFLPTYKMKRLWNGRTKETSAPLFPGYVFCRFDVQKRLPVLITPGVIAVVGRGKTPLPVDDKEMDAVQKAVSCGLPAEPWPFLELGQRVRIESESLMGLEGILVSFKGNQRIILSVSLLRRSVALEIDRSFVKPVVPERTSVFGSIGFHPTLQSVAT
jgi:transcription antitermination factor NusG